MRSSVYFDRKNLQFVGLDDALMQGLKQAYKGIDVEQEIKKMCLWLISGKGTSRRPGLSFITSWLYRASPTAIKNSESPAPPHLLDTLVKQYMQEVWEKAQDVLQSNQIQP